MDWWVCEKKAVADGWRILCGVDEAGRGCLAGPVFAAAVILPHELMIPGLDDSKRLKPSAREALFDVIVRCAVSYGIASASEHEIDEVNILNATYLAMNRAISKLDPQTELALIDGNRSKGIRYINHCIVGGDGKSASIAAASILAKVSRDRYMKELAGRHPEYLFEKHKGYATALHYEMLRKYGPSCVHRQTFFKKDALKAKRFLECWYWIQSFSEAGAKRWLWRTSGGINMRAWVWGTVPASERLTLL